MQRNTQVFFTDGNLAVAPAHIVSEPRVEERQTAHKKKERLAQKKHSHQRMAMHASRVRAFNISMLVLFLCAFALLFVSLQSSVQERMNHISAMESELSEMKLSNDAAQSRIQTATNLNHIRDYATNQLGMHYAGSGQIRYYEMSGRDYMVLYEQVP